MAVPSTSLISIFAAVVLVVLCSLQQQRSCMAQQPCDEPISRLLVDDCVADAISGHVRKGVDSCCSRIQSDLNFDCYCGDGLGADVPQIIFDSAQRCRLDHPNAGRCSREEDCGGIRSSDLQAYMPSCKASRKEYRYRASLQRKRIGVNLHIKPFGESSCCKDLGRLDFNCLCSPTSKVTLPVDFSFYARKCENIAVPDSGKCKAD